MPDPSPEDQHLARLRQWRTPADRTSDLSFIQRLFKQRYEKPHRQLESLVDLWRQHVPADLQPSTRLESFQRGTLKVIVDSSATLYELDQLLRGGLRETLVTAHRLGTLRRVQLRIGNLTED